MKKTLRLRADVVDLEGARARFLAKVRIEGEHWLWTVTQRDIGSFRVNGNGWLVLSANRAAWLLWRGDLPPDDHVVATCPDALRCMRPEHLQDRAKNEHSARPNYKPKGDELARKLTSGVVQRILHWRRRGWTQVRIAEKFGVSDGMVAHILRGRAWSSVTGIPQRARR